MSVDAARTYEPDIFKGPTMVFWTSEKHAFHALPEGAQAFATLPGR